MAAGKLSPLAQVARKRLRLSGQLAWLGAVSLPFVGLGCLQFVPSALVAGHAPAIIRASAQEIEELPPVQNPAPGGPSSLPPIVNASDPRPLPINLDSVLRLAEGQNAKIAEARARVQEAFAGQDVARLSWLPALNVGPSYYRHEGGITNDASAPVPYGALDHASFEPAGMLCVQIAYGMALGPNIGMRLLRG